MIPGENKVSNNNNIFFGFNYNLLLAVKWKNIKICSKFELLLKIATY